MNVNDFLKYAKKAVADSHNDHYGSDSGHISEDNVFLVWFSKTLQNNKAILVPDLFDGTLYEVTWNGDKGEGYLDMYEKKENRKLPDPRDLL